MCSGCWLCCVTFVLLQVCEPEGGGTGSSDTCLYGSSFLNTLVESVPSGWCLMFRSRKGKVPSSSSSYVKSIEGSMELRLV